MHFTTVKQAILITMVCAFLLVSFRVWAQEKESSNEKVAVVNGVTITSTEYEREFNFYLEEASRKGQQIPDFALPKIKNDLLESLITRELLYQESQKKGIKIDQKAIGDQLKTIKQRFPSEAEFENAINRMGLSIADIESQINRNMAIRELMDKQVTKKIVVTDPEAKAYYDANPSLFKKPEQVRARHILIKVDAAATETQKAEARKEIQEIQQKLKNGEDFAALAQEFSQGPSNANGGDLGYFGRGQMVKPFEDTAFALKPNEISDIVETQFGYHLIKVEDKKPEGTLAYADIKDQLNQHLKRQKAEKEAGTYIDTLRKGAKIEKYL